LKRFAYIFTDFWNAVPVVIQTVSEGIVFESDRYRF